jgi:hypothetical protein
MKFTTKEYIMLGGTAVAGYIATDKKFLLWLNTLNAWQGFLFYYAILFTVVFLVSKVGFNVGIFKADNMKQTIGVMLFLFAIFTIINWENPYVQYVTKGNIDGASNVFYGSEDGMSWSLFYDYFHMKTPETIRYLAFMLVPVISMALSLILIRDHRTKIPIGP